MSHRQLKDRTREHYEMPLEQHLKLKFGTWPLSSITADDVRAWHAKFGTKTPTIRSHCYGLLRTILGTAASDGKISVNPCVIRGAGATAGPQDQARVAAGAREDHQPTTCPSPTGR